MVVAEGEDASMLLEARSMARRATSRRLQARGVRAPSSAGTLTAQRASTASVSSGRRLVHGAPKLLLPSRRSCAMGTRMMLQRSMQW